MKVCFVGLSTLPLPPVKGGAVERTIQETARHLAEKGVEVHIISIWDDLINDQVLEENKFAVFHHVRIPRLFLKYPVNQLAKGLFYFGEAGKLVNEIHPDIVHYSNYPAAVYVAARQYKKRYPNIINFHNMDYGWNFFAKRLDRFLFGKGFNRSDFFIAVSDYIKDHVLRKYEKFVNGRIVTVHNGVNIEIFRPREKKSLRQKIGLEENDPVLIFAGRIDPRKGIDTLLDAFSQAKRRINNLKLIIIGPMGSFWHEKPQEFSLHIQRRIESMRDVRLLQPEYDKEKLAEIYSMADIACLPSEFPEGFPLTALEMQACGVPVIATDAGGMKEAYLDGYTGFYVRQKDAADLSEKIEKLVLNAQLRQEMSANARKWVEENFSWKIIADKLIGIYQQVSHHG